MNEAKRPYIVVVGVDLSETGNLALEKALELAASRPDGELHAVRVAEPLWPAEIAYVPNSPYSPETLQQAADQLKRHVEKVVAEVRARPGEAGRLPARIVTHLRLDAPSEEIAQLASDLEADLVVVGTQGKRGFSRLLLGSVAEAVVRLSPCPVLVVRPKRIVETPRIEPPCPRCVEARKASNGEKLWCEQHSERHGQRHTYHQSDRVSSDGTFPLLFRS